MPAKVSLARQVTSDLIELIVYKSAIVNELIAEDYVETFHNRSVLERLAAHLVFPNLTEENFEKMRTADDEIRKWVTKMMLNFSE